MVLAQSSGFGYLGTEACAQVKGLSKSAHSTAYRTQHTAGEDGSSEP